MTLLLEHLTMAGMVHIRISTGRDLDHLAQSGYMVMTEHDWAAFRQNVTSTRDAPPVTWAIIPQIVPAVMEDRPAPQTYLH